jgi:hypothetical protein
MKKLIKFEEKKVKLLMKKIKDDGKKVIKKDSKKAEGKSK